MSLNVSELSMGEGNDALDGGTGGSTDVHEGGVEEDGVVVDPESASLMSKRDDGCKSLRLCGWGIGLVLEEETDDSGRGVAHGTKDISIAGEVGGRHETPDVQGEAVKRMRRIAVTS